MRKILIYSWGGFTDTQLLTVLKRAGFHYVHYARQLVDYHKDLAAAKEIIELIHREKVGILFSYNYIPLLSMVAHTTGLPYVSWIYDCPHYTLLSQTIANEENYFFCFDRVQAEALRKKGIKKVFHMPLGVDSQDMEERILAGRKKRGKRKAEQEGEIAFVGSFYNQENNRLRHASLSPLVKGYLDGVIEAQLLVYGGHFIPEVLTEEVQKELCTVCQLHLGEGYQDEPVELAAGIVDKEITARERERVLAALGKHHQLHVYTGSAVPKSVSGQPGYVFKGFADVQTQMPVIFNESPINVNISLKSITSGIPQRVLDILACGGFCLTNYQPEIAEYFVDGQELVMYASLADLQEKAAYYLTHEEERKRIAALGKQRIKEAFDLEMRVKEILGLVVTTQ